MTKEELVELRQIAEQVADDYANERAELRKNVTFMLERVRDMLRRDGMSKAEVQALAILVFFEGWRAPGGEA